MVFVDQADTVFWDYDAAKEIALKKVAAVLEECLSHFHGEEYNPRIREDIANYTIGYLGLSYGLHAPR